MMVVARRTRGDMLQDMRNKGIVATLRRDLPHLGASAALKSLCASQRQKRRRERTTVLS